MLNLIKICGAKNHKDIEKEKNKVIKKIDRTTETIKIINVKLERLSKRSVTLDIARSIGVKIGC